MFQQDQTTDPPSPLFYTPPFTNTISVNGGQYLWVHGQAAWVSALGGGSTLNSTMLRVLDNGTARIVVRGTVQQVNLKLTKEMLLEPLPIYSQHFQEHGRIVVWSLML